MNISPQLSIELVWEDEDLEELLISASNGRYAGMSRVYFAHGDLEDLANRIEGFPLSVTQQVFFSGGQKDSGGFAELLFHCVDGAGHASVRVSLAEAYQDYRRPTVTDRVELEIRFEPAALDEFWRDMQQVALRRIPRAVLRGLGAGSA